MNWLRRLSAWLWGIDMRAAEAEARTLRRRETIYTIADGAGELERAIDTVAAAMPNGNGNQINGQIYDDIETRKAMLHHMISGGSVIYAVDWQYHPTHCVVATTQPNGRALLTIYEQSQILKKGS